MKKKTRSQKMFAGFSDDFEAFVNNSILFCIKETDNRTTADEILFTAYSSKSPSYHEIEEIYHKKFPIQNKIR